MIRGAHNTPTGLCPMLELLGKWQAELISAGRGETAMRHARSWDRVLELYPDTKKPGDLDYFDVQDYRAWRLKRGISRRTVYQELVAIRRFYRWLTTRGLPFANPAIGVRV